MANDFTYDVCLFVRHASMDLAEITREMSNWPVAMQANAGAMFREVDGRIRSRESPAPFTFWKTRLTPAERPHSSNQTLEDFLTEALTRLNRHAQFFESVTHRGGYIALSIACFGEGLCVGMCLSANLFRELGRLSMSVELSIYAPNGS